MLNALIVLMGMGLGYEIDKEGISAGTEGQGGTSPHGQGQKTPVQVLHQIIQPISKVPQTVKTDIYNTMKKEQGTAGNISIQHTISNDINTVKTAPSEIYHALTQAKSDIAHAPAQIEHVVTKTLPTDTYHALTQAKSDIAHAPAQIEHVVTKTLPSEIYSSLVKDKNSAVDTVNTVRNDLSKVFKW